MNFDKIVDQIGGVVLGKAEQIRLALTCLLACGHLLIEDLPGLGKTMLIRTLADALSLSFSRIQFTPDLMPADVTGYELLGRGTDGEGPAMVFRPGPVFANLLLAAIAVMMIRKGILFFVGVAAPS